MKKIAIALCSAFAVCITTNAQRWSIGTNALDYINFGTLNVEGSVAVSRHFAVDIGAKFNPWSFGNQASGQVRQNRQRFFYAGVKWYPWFIFDGWHFDALGGYREYNSGGIFKQETEEGDAFGGGVGFGYTLPVHKNLNVEFGAMLWAGRKVYTVYACPVCGRQVENGAKFFIMPTNITIGATWVFGRTGNREAREARRQNYVEIQ